MPDSKEREINCRILTGNVSISAVDGFLSVLRAIADKHAVTIQAMDAALIAGEEHIKSAVRKAVRAVEKKEGITNDLGLEILLYAAGRRQIERALAMGVREGEKEEVAIVIVDTGGGGEDLGVVAEEVKRNTEIVEVPVQKLGSDLGRDEHKRAKLKQFFAITEDEINAVGEKKLKLLVLERVALLDVLK